VKFININITSFDAHKHGSAIAVVADAREALNELITAISGYSVDAAYAKRITAEKVPRKPIRIMWNHVKRRRNT